MSVSIQVESLSKRYRLGLTHAGSVRDLVNAALGRVLGRSRKGKSVTVDDESRVEDGHFWALKDVSFEVSTGEVIGIIGKNGAGKSTLLKLLSRITHPTSGRAVLNGRVASLLEVGTGFHPELTGRENVYLNGTILGMTRREIDGQLDDIVDFAGISKFIDTPVKRYSSGMTVRLGFAVAAHLDPEILIVDEVLAVGDVEFQKRCLGKMQNVAESGKTVLFVSHNLASIRTLTTRTVVLSGGKLVFDGDTAEGVARYVKENVRDENHDIDIANAPRSFPGLDRKLEFLDMAIGGRNEDGSLSAQHFELNLHIRAREAVSKSFMVGVTVYANDKTPVGSMFSTPLAPPAPGENRTYILKNELGLAPGSYHCAISITGAGADTQQVHDSLSDVLPFEIGAAAMGRRIWKPGWGMIELPELIAADGIR